MRWFSINIQLKILIVDEKTPTTFEDGKVRIVTLGQHVQVVPMRQLSFYLNHLTAYFRPTNCMNV